MPARRQSCAADYQKCWLKHAGHPEIATPDMGREVAWVSGTVGADLSYDLALAWPLEEGYAKGWGSGFITHLNNPKNLNP
jgi:hypothetical protein